MFPHPFLSVANWALLFPLGSGDSHSLVWPDTALLVSTGAHSNRTRGPIQEDIPTSIDVTYMNLCLFLQGTHRKERQKC